MSVSFSSNNYVDHVFGPSSLEAEDNLLHLDRTLAELFAYIDESVGLKRTLIVLSADPVIFAGAGIKGQQISRTITPYDIAPTLSAVLGISLPAATVGEPLVEIVDR